MSLTHLVGRARGRHLQKPGTNVLSLAGDHLKPFALLLVGEGKIPSLGPLGSVSLCSDSEPALRLDRLITLREVLMPNRPWGLAALLYLVTISEVPWGLPPYVQR